MFRTISVLATILIASATSAQAHGTFEKREHGGSCSSGGAQVVRCLPPGQVSNSSFTIIMAQCKYHIGRSPSLPATSFRVHVGPLAEISCRHPALGKVQSCEMTCFKSDL